MASKAIKVIDTNLRLHVCFYFIFGNMTLLFAKSYKNDALYELQVEAVPRLQLHRQYPPLRLHECIHSINNALLASRYTHVRERDITGKDATLHSCDN